MLPIARVSAKFTHLLFVTPKVGFVSLRTLSLSASLDYRSRHRDREFVRPPVNRRWLTEDEEHLDALEDFINQDGSQAYGLRLQQKTEELIHREVRQQERKVKKRIMERKYFKKPQEVNLLTWNAKQQIRYLYQEFPEEWTPEQLAESFPISLEGVHRLLKNSYTPRSEQEIAKHDRRVMAHWQQLQETLTLGSGPLEDSQRDKFQHVIEAGKLPLMVNARGSPQLPAPAPRPAAKSGAPEHRKMGLFESLVAGSATVTAQEEVVSKQTEDQKDTEVRLLKEIVGFPKKRRKVIPANSSDRSTQR